MKYSKILICITVLVCLAFQACAVSESPNNISPNNISSNNISSNNTSSNNKSSNITMIPGELHQTKMSGESNAAIVSNESRQTKMSGESINAAMVPNESNITMGSRGDYLNPNKISSEHSPSFSWYSTGVSFYNQGVPDTTFSPFTEYYTTSGMPIVGGIISTPVKFDIAQRMPSMIYYGTGQTLPYNQYVSTVPSGTNELWVQGATNWAQYVVSPVGTWIQLVANAPVGGSGGFYEIVQTDTSTVKYNTYQFYQGYNTMNFNADQVGRHMFYFVVNNQPSNVVIVDVFAQVQPGSMPPSSM
jgi:hypothetical protein